MIKLMIVDDMPVYREYLRNFVDWGTYGFEVCCEAKDGKEALELYDKYQPDIVLTDIVMPFMDGLELSEKLLKDNPDVSIILITGNSEFEYARKAVKLGVCDYIVKPFEKEELIITLLKLQDNINRVLEMQNEQDKSKEERREKLFWQYIYAGNEIESNRADKKNPFQYSYFLVVTIRIDLYENKVDAEEIVNWKQVLSTLLQNMLQINGSKEIFQDFEGNIVTILNFADRKSMEDYGGYEFSDIIELAKQYIGFSISVGISDYCYDAVNLKEAYCQTIQALSNAYKEHHSKMFYYKKTKKEDSFEFYSWDLIDEINKCLEILNYERIEKLILQELDRIKEYENSEYSTMIYTSLLSVLLSYFVKQGRNIDDIFGRGFRPYFIINNATSYACKRKFICECYRKSIDYLLKHMDSKSHQIAEQARKYIELNYSNPELSITNLSRELLVNQTYLRRMFKEEYKMTISDYITKYRMEKAKELIKTENSKLSYISYGVGYNDASYFSKCFKKFFGYLPSDIIREQSL